MDFTEDLALIERQEKELLFEHFDEDVAWQIGSLLHDRAVANGLPLAIDVRRFDRPLFFAARPGVTADNHDWVRRKADTVRRFLRSTYGLQLALARDGADIAARYHLSKADYVAAGGGFPLAVRSAGIIGSITVSGLPDRQDHQFVVAALCAFLGRDPGDYALSG